MNVGVVLDLGGPAATLDRETSAALRAVVDAFGKARDLPHAAGRLASYNFV